MAYPSKARCHHRTRRSCQRSRTFLIPQFALLTVLLVPSHCPSVVAIWASTIFDTQSFPLHRRVEQHRSETHHTVRLIYDGTHRLLRQYAVTEPSFQPSCASRVIEVGQDRPQLCFFAHSAIVQPTSVLSTNCPCQRLCRCYGSQQYGTRHTVHA